MAPFESRRMGSAAPKAKLDVSRTDMSFIFAATPRYGTLKVSPRLELMPMKPEYTGKVLASTPVGGRMDTMNAPKKRGQTLSLVEVKDTDAASGTLGRGEVYGKALVLSIVEIVKAGEWVIV